MENAGRSLKSFLCSLEKGELVDLLLSVANRNHSFRERLNQLKQKAEGQEIDLEGFKNRILVACTPDRYVGYRDVVDFANRIRQSLEPIDAMMAAKEFADVLPLIDFAIACVHSAFENCHDDMGDVSSILDGLMEHHWTACQAIKPPGPELGHWVFIRQRSNAFGLFKDLLSRYSELMRGDGLAAYEAEIRKAWARLPVMSNIHGRNGERSLLIEMTTEWARFVGHPELLEDLQSAFVQRQLKVIPEVERDIHALLDSKRSSEVRYGEKLIQEVAAVLNGNGPAGSWSEFVERLKRRHPRKIHRLQLPG